MKVYSRRDTPVKWVRFRVPGRKAPVRVSTGETEQRAAERAGRAIMERELRRHAAQAELFGSADSYAWEQAIEDWQRERMQKGLSLATINSDGDHVRWFGRAEDGEGRRLFAGRPLREITSADILTYIEGEQARGLVNETIARRLATLRQILHSAAVRRGSDGRPYLPVAPVVPVLPPSRASDGWGRALTPEEYFALIAALPVTGERAPGWGRGVPASSVDQRGWVEVCVWSSQHFSDVNDFCPEHFNLGGGDRSLRYDGIMHRLQPGTFLWRNTKNAHRTRRRHARVRTMPPPLAAVLERLVAARGAREGVPIAGYWNKSNCAFRLNAAAKKAGIAPVMSDRGKPHLVSSNDLRRTGATWIAIELTTNGSGPDRSAVEIIADWLGHAGIEVARAIYDRAVGVRLDAAAAALGRFAERMGPKSAPPGAPVVSMLDYLKKKG